MKKLLFVLMSVSAFLGVSTVSAQGTYAKITTTDELVEDGVYLIATSEYGMALSKNFNNNAARERAEITVTNGIISSEVAASSSDNLPYEIILKKNGENWALYDVVNQKYIARTTDDANKIQNQDEPYEWKITIDAEGNADIVSLEETARRILYNSNAGQERFSAYKAANTTNKVVQLYKRDGVYVDETAPEINYIVTESAVNTAVEVHFSEALDKSSAETVANYTINNDITVSAAQLGDDKKTVVLTTSALTEGSDYELTVNGVKDVAGNATENLKFVFTFGAIEVENIAALCALRNSYVENQNYRVKGEVVITAIVGKNGSNQSVTNVWVQDKGCTTSVGHSMMLYAMQDKLPAGAKVGDVLTGLAGQLTVYYDLIEMQNIDAATLALTGETAEVVVDDVTIADLNGADKFDYQNAMVRIKNVEFNEAGEVFEANVSYKLLGENNNIDLYTNREGDYLGQKIPLGAQDVICYVGYHNAPQVCIRAMSDIQPHSPLASEKAASIPHAVYPNPTTGMVNVETEGFFNVDVYAVNGAQVLTLKGLNTSAQIDLSGLAKGLYMLQINAANGTVRTKVIVR